MCVLVGYASSAEDEDVQPEKAAKVEACDTPPPNPPSATASPLPPDSAPSSPYTAERQRIRELTMPRIANFAIPDSPPPPPAHKTEDAAHLAATTKKFSRFLELKKQGVHFNSRLQDSSSLRNPGLRPKLMAFAGVSEEESYASTLPPAVDVRRVWPEESYVEALLRQNERREKKRLAGRERVEFVPAQQGSGAESGAGTPRSGVGAGEGGKKRSRFDT